VAVLPIVVGDPKRGIQPALEKGWLDTARTVTVPAVFATRESETWAETVNEERFIARFGRPPLASEVGCAMAHVGAYRAFLESSCTWALVFEDDARILDERQLASIVTRVVEKLQPTGQVVSLYSDGPVFASDPSSVRSDSILRLRLPPPGAVAYLLDRVAASALVDAQQHVGSVSDWPHTNGAIVFNFAPNSTIGHSSCTTDSTIAAGVDRSVLVPVFVRILMWTGVWYVRYRHQFQGLSDYYDQVMRPRLAHKFWLRLDLCGHNSQSGETPDLRLVRRNWRRG